ncbi:hypothetical protein [Asanoa siamensis]|uniref:Uncharacterized protein n=1 Tax=Asanoa siamensis TaxID=926357 RepID=A0ABQ4CX91_9ACTN|nr:hypothetical protein [Asanoa siamensis]GIF75904.1 hypothetical protein Asi02nite_54220 [Asanoa siamensis]
MFEPPYRPARRLWITSAAAEGPHSAAPPAFYEDLKRVCATYGSGWKPICDGLAWTYYQAVKTFGKVAVSQADLDKACAQVAELRRQEALARA